MARRREVAPSFGLVQLVPHPGPASIADIPRADRSLETGRLNIPSRCNPIFNVREPRGAQTEEVDLPAHDDWSETERAFPVRMRWHELV